MTSQALFQLKPLSLSKPLVPCQASLVFPSRQAVPLVALSARPVSLCSKVPVSKSLYFVRQDESFVIIGRESYFIDSFGGQFMFS